MVYTPHISANSASTFMLPMRKARRRSGRNAGFYIGGDQLFYPNVISVFLPGFARYAVNIQFARFGPVNRVNFPFGVCVGLAGIDRGIIAGLFAGNGNVVALRVRGGVRLFRFGLPDSSEGKEEEEKQAGNEHFFHVIQF